MRFLSSAWKWRQSLRVKAEDFTEVDNVAVCLKAAVDCGLAVDDATVAALLEAVAGRCHQLATKKIRFLLLLLGRAYGADQPLRRPLQAALQRRLVRMLTQWRPGKNLFLQHDRVKKNKQKKPIDEQEKPGKKNKVASFRGLLG